MIPHEEVDVSKMETPTPTSEKSSAVGNAAAMREALDKILWCLEWMSDNTENKSIKEHLAKPIELAKSALSAPPRNCDAFSKAHVLEMLEDRSFSKEDTIEWIFSEAKGVAK